MTQSRTDRDPGQRVAEVELGSDPLENLAPSHLERHARIHFPILARRVHPGAVPAGGLMMRRRLGMVLEAESLVAESQPQLDVLRSVQRRVKTADADQVLPPDRGIAGVELARSCGPTPGLHVRVLPQKRPGLPPDPGRDMHADSRRQQRTDHDQVSPGGVRFGMTCNAPSGGNHIIIQEEHQLATRVRNAEVARRGRATVWLLEHAQGRSAGESLRGCRIAVDDDEDLE
jgi:hypothetical protein